jgi:hypothetical protein
LSQTAEIFGPLFKAEKGVGVEPIPKLKCLVVRADAKTPAKCRLLHQCLEEVASLYYGGEVLLHETKGIL